MRPRNSDRLDGRAPMSRMCAMQIRHPVDMLLDRLDHAGQHRRAAGAGDGEQIGKARRRHAEIGPGSGAPFLGQRQAVAAGDPDLVERARHRGKAGGADDGVERIFDAVDFDAVRGEALDRRLRDVDQLHVRQIVGLEVAGIDAQPLAAEDVVRAQQVGGRRILDDAADLVAREFGDGVVGRLFEQRSP